MERQHSGELQCGYPVVYCTSFFEACEHVYTMPQRPGVTIADIDRTIRDQSHAMKSLKPGLITPERLEMLCRLNKATDVYAVTNQWSHCGHQIARIQSGGGTRYPINPHAILDVLGENRVFGRQEPWPTTRRGMYFKNREESVGMVADAILTNSFDVVLRGVVGIGDRLNDVRFALKVREKLIDILGAEIPFTGILLPPPPYEHWRIGSYIP